MVTKINNIKPNPRNPRLIRDSRFDSLCTSLREFPEMLEKRPLVCFTDTDGKFVVLGGNMRLKAAKEIGLKELPIMLADDWTAEQKDQFLIKDNLNFGEFNFDELQADWDVEQLEAWGLEHDWEVGDIVELPQITTTYNVNIKCDEPMQVEQLKERLGISSNSIHIQELYKLLK
jgi:ParB-like chromosome segregation protein Spo0J